MMPTLKLQIQHQETYESSFIFQRNRMATDTNWMQACLVLSTFEKVGCLNTNMGIEA